MNNEKAVKIIVAGDAGTGKTTIGLHIRKALTKLGFKTEFCDEDCGYDYVRKHIDNPNVIKSIKEHGVIKIETKQLMRKG